MAWACMEGHICHLPDPGPVSASVPVPALCLRVGPLHTLGPEPHRQGWPPSCPCPLLSLCLWWLCLVQAAAVPAASGWWLLCFVP